MSHLNILLSVCRVVAPFQLQNKVSLHLVEPYASIRCDNILYISGAFYFVVLYG